MRLVLCSGRRLGTFGLGLRGVYRILSARSDADLGATDSDQLDLVLISDQKEDDQLDLVP
jgi:hypothetical protein